jgi:predicted TIM-barrel fold metal-dependent hydrolase
MAQNGVDRAAVVAARIEHNPDDNEYVAACVRQHPAQLVQLADVDCQWSDTYQAPGAADRLAAAVAGMQLKGFTHYVRANDDGAWYLSAEGTAFFAKAAELKQIASLAAPARLQRVFRQVAERFPTIPFLFHHMAGARLADPATLAAILPSAALPNVHVKLSGFHYVSPRPWGFPYPECRPIMQALFDGFGPERLHWGSDYPVVREAMTYQQSLEAVRTHCDFISSRDMARVLGDSLADLLDR